MSLSELQSQMVELLQRRRALTGDPDCVRFAQAHFSGGPRVSPIEQLEIYREQFWLRHTSALVEDFPLLGRLLGQNDWERLVEDYLGAHPPLGSSLRDLGARLPGFVGQAGVWLENGALACDLAHFEWAHVEVFDAPESGPLKPAILAALSPTQLESSQLVLSPALRLLRADYPIVDFAERLRRADSGPVRLPEPHRFFFSIYRSELRIRNESLSEAAFTLLHALAERASLAEACERTAALGASHAEELGAELREWFTQWVQRGWIVDVLPAPAGQ